MFDRLLRWIKPKERRPPLLEKGEEALPNDALGLAQEWGENWLKPIQERLRQTYPQMSQAELDRLNTIAQAAMKSGHDLVYSIAEKDGAKINQSVWEQIYLKEYPWVDQANLGHLFSTGMYYAWKAGLA